MQIATAAGRPATDAPEGLGRGFAAGMEAGHERFRSQGAKAAGDEGVAGAGRIHHLDGPDARGDDLAAVRGDTAERTAGRAGSMLAGLPSGYPAPTQAEALSRRAARTAASSSMPHRGSALGFGFLPR